MRSDYDLVTPPRNCRARVHLSPDPNGVSLAHEPPARGDGIEPDPTWREGLGVLAVALCAGTAALCAVGLGSLGALQVGAWLRGVSL